VSKLGREAQALVDAGRDAQRPTADDRERVLRGLRSRIGDGKTLREGGAPPPATGAAKIGTPMLSLLIGGFSVLGLIAFQALRSSPAEVGASAPLPPVAAPLPPTEAPLPPIEEPLPPVAVPPPAVVEAPSIPEAPSAAPASTPAPRHASSARRRADRLADEITLLSRAQTNLHARRFGSALRLLDEHQRKFPNGALTQERLATRVQALCALGRTSEAEVDLARLARLSPPSPLESRAREACMVNRK
jgi:hypothetical protein